MRMDSTGAAHPCFIEGRAPWWIKWQEKSSVGFHSGKDIKLYFKVSSQGRFE